MPNWCMNTITFNGPEKPIKELRDFISEQRDIPNVAELGHFATNTWLGTFLGRAGFNYDDYECRGQIVAWPDDIADEKDPSSFTIQTETAWSPMIAMWDAIAKKFSDDIEVIYTAEETGMALYYTNDPAMRGHYCVDKFDEVDEDLKESLRGTIFEGELSMEEYSEKEVVDNILLVYPDKTDLTTEQLVELFQSKYEDSISINAYEWCLVEEVG